MFTLSVWTGPLPLSILTVAGIVAGAPGSPKFKFMAARIVGAVPTPVDLALTGMGASPLVYSLDIVE
jgi:hypothetical protein